MTDYLTKPTLYERFEGYKQSEDFQRDLANARQYYETICKLMDEPPVPDDRILNAVLAEKFQWLEANDECTRSGHVQQFAQHDDGSSEMYCERCDSTLTMAGG